MANETTIIEEETDTVNMIAPSGGVVKGVPIMVGTNGICVIPKVTAAAGVLFAGKTRCQARLPKNTSTAFTVGQKVEWDVSAGELIALGSVSGDIEVGYVLEAAGSSDTHAKILFGYTSPTVNA